MITFKNGNKLETIAIYGGTMQYQNANRSTLEIRCSTATTTFDELKALYTDVDALSEMTISEIQSNQKMDQDGNLLYIDSETGYETTVSEGNKPAMLEREVIQSVHLNYTIPVELKLTTIDDNEVYCMKLAQMSNIEIVQTQQATDITNIEAALIELAEMEVTNNG